MRSTLIFGNTENGHGATAPPEGLASLSPVWRRGSVPFALLVCLSVFLQAEVNAPRVGYVRAADQTIRPLYGLPASFILGKPVLRSAVGAGFSNEGGLVALDGKIQLLGPDASLIAEYATPDSHPVLHIEDQPSTAIAWLPSSQTILRFDGSAFVATSLSGPLPGTVSSIRLVGNNAELLFANAGTVTQVAVALDSGNIISQRLLPSVEAPAFQYGSFVIFKDAEGLEIEAADASRRTLPLPSRTISIESIAAGWVHIGSSDATQSWILHLTGTELELSELPAPPAARRASAAVLTEGEK